MRTPTTSTITASLLIALATVTHAGPTPEQKCTVKKLTAVAKDVSGQLACNAKALKKGVGTDPACIMKADDKLSSAFDAAEAKGGCATPDDKGNLKAIVDSAVAAFVAALPDGGTDEGRACAASKLGATAKKASGKLACQAKAIGKGTAVDMLCLGKAEDKFMKAFTKADLKGGCVDPGDASTVETLVNTFVGDVVAALTGGQPPVVSFASDVQPIFTAHCATALFCHTGSSPAQGMNLSAGMAYAAIVGVASMEMSSLDRVAPGDPANSYLVRKINGGPGIVGSQMPLGGPFLSAADIATITNWVQQGAANN
jgi:hypothetical protein